VRKRLCGRRQRLQPRAPRHSGDDRQTDAMWSNIIKKNSHLFFTIKNNYNTYALETARSFYSDVNFANFNFGIIYNVYITYTMCRYEYIISISPRAGLF